MIFICLLFEIHCVCMFVCSLSPVPTSVNPYDCLRIAPNLFLQHCYQAAPTPSAADIISNPCRDILQVVASLTSTQRHSVLLFCMRCWCLYFAWPTISLSMMGQVRVRTTTRTTESKQQRPQHITAMKSIPPQENTHSDGSVSPPSGIQMGPIPRVR